MRVISSGIRRRIGNVPTAYASTAVVDHKYDFAFFFLIQSYFQSYVTATRVVFIELAID